MKKNHCKILDSLQYHKLNRFDCGLGSFVLGWIKSCWNLIKFITLAFYSDQLACLNGKFVEKRYFSWPWFYCMTMLSFYKCNVANSHRTMNVIVHAMYSPDLLLLGCHLFCPMQHFDISNKLDISKHFLKELMKSNLELFFYK